jgi:phosphoribosylformylglycinamidine (FGAM) synthase-like amidotransferase family enzyme
VLSQNVGVGTTTPTNSFHVVRAPGNPNPDPLRVEDLRNSNVDTAFLVIDNLGVVKYINLTDLRKNITGNLDSLIVVTMINNADTLFNSSSFSDSLRGFIYNNADTLFSNQPWLDMLASRLKDSIDSDVDSLVISNLDSLYLYEDGKRISVYLPDIDSTNELIDTVFIQGDSLVIGEKNRMHYLSMKALIDSFETVTTLSNTDSTLVYTDENGIATVLNIKAMVDSIETLTSISFTDSTITYLDEDGSPTVIDVGAMIDSMETLTSITNTDSTITYVDENGVSTVINVGSMIDSMETVTSVSKTDSTISYVDENGDTTVLDVKAMVDSIETVSTLVDNGDGTFTYRDEDGTVTTYNSKDTVLTYFDKLNDSTLYYVDENGDTSKVDIKSMVDSIETVTSITNTDSTITYVDENGVSTVINVGVMIDSMETVTSVSKTDSTISYVDENGDTTVLDVKAMVDSIETVSTLVDNGDGTFTYRDEDGTVITYNSKDTVLTYFDKLNDSTLYYVDENGDTSKVDIKSMVDSIETVTSITNTDSTITYVDENGVSTVINVGVMIDSMETVTSVSKTDSTISYVDENGDTTVLDVKAMVDSIETVSTLVDNGDGTFTYRDEDGTVITYNSKDTVLTYFDKLNDSTLYYVDENGDTSKVDVTSLQVTETVTSITNTDSTITYVDENGVSTVINVGAMIDSMETVTSVSKTDSTISYIDENGDTTTLDVKAMVDSIETVSTLVDNGDGTFTYRDEDGTVTTYNSKDTVLTYFDKLNDSTLYYVNENGDTSKVDVTSLQVTETVTSITNTDSTITYVDENGVSTVINVGSMIDSMETVTSVSKTDSTISYIDENGDTTTLDVKAMVDSIETVSTLVDNGDGTFTYRDEDGTVTTYNSKDTVLTYFDKLNDSTLYYVDENGDTSKVDIKSLQVTESLTKIMNTDSTISYVDENGDTTTLDVKAMVDSIETVSTLVDNGDGTFTYTDEDGVVTTYNSKDTVLTYFDKLNDSTLYYVDENGDTSKVDVTSMVDAVETVTSITNTDSTITYVDEDGVSTTLNVGAMVDSMETVTSVSKTDSTISYIDENGDTTVLDVKAMVDSIETVSTLVDNGDGTFTYRDEDGVVTTYNSKDTVLTYFDKLNDSTLYYVDENGDTSKVDIKSLQVTESLTKIMNTDSTISYVDENGDTTTLDVKAMVDSIETVSTLVDNGDGTFTYRDEDGTVTTYNSKDTVLTYFDKLNDSMLYYVDENGDTSKVDIKSMVDSIETVTSITNTDSTITYVDENGVSTVINVGSMIDSMETVTSVSKTDSTISYVDENGDTTTLDVKAMVDSIETVSTLVDNGDGTFTYRDEDGVVTTYNSKDTVLTYFDKLNDSMLYYVDENGDTSKVDIKSMVDSIETVTSITNTDSTITYVDENGVSTVINVGSMIDSMETVTSVSKTDSTISYVDENGDTTVLDVKAMVDSIETVSTLVDNGDGTFTYRDEDGTVTTYNSKDTVLTYFDNLNDSTLYYVDENGDTSKVDIKSLQVTESLTKIMNTDSTISYVDENGDTTVLDVKAMVDSIETVSTLVDNGDGTFTYTDEDGTVTTYNSKDTVLTSIKLDNDTLVYQDEKGVDTKLYLEDLDTTNELQLLSISNDTLYLSDGNSVYLGSISSDNDQDSTNEYNTGLSMNGSSDSLIITDAGTRYAVAVTDILDTTSLSNRININRQAIIDSSNQIRTTLNAHISSDEDLDTTNELQLLSISNDTLYLSDGNSVYLGSISSDNDQDSTNEYNTGLSMNGSSDSLIITDAGTRYAVAVTDILDTTSLSNRININRQAIIDSSNQIRTTLNAHISSDEDLDTTNELQLLSISNDTLYLSDGNSVYLGSISSDNDQDSTNEYNTGLSMNGSSDSLIITDAGTRYAVAVTDILDTTSLSNRININRQAIIDSSNQIRTTLNAHISSDEDLDTTNELQLLSISNDTLYLSDGNSVYLGSISSDNDQDSTNEYNTGLSMNGSSDSLIITDAGTRYAVAVTDILDTTSLSNRININRQAIIDSSNQIRTTLNAHISSDEDLDTTNELQLLSISNDTLYLSDGNSVYLGSISSDNDQDSTNEYNTGLSMNGSSDSLIITDAGTRYAVAVTDILDTTSLSNRININRQAIIDSSNQIRTTLNAHISSDEDLDTTNELQLLSISNDTLYLSDGNSVYLGSISSDNDQDSTNEYNTGLSMNGSSDSLIITDAGTRYAVAVTDILDTTSLSNRININRQAIIDSSNQIRTTLNAHISSDEDLDTTNELQLLSISNDTLYLSDGNSVYLGSISSDNDQDSTNEYNTGLSMNGSSDSLIITDAGTRYAVAVTDILDTTSLSNRININRQAIIDSSNQIRTTLNAHISSDEDLDTTNELQLLSISNDTLYLSDGNSVYLGSISSDNDQDSTNELITSVAITGDSLKITEAGKDWPVYIEDMDSTNEIIDSVKLEKDTLNIYEGGSSFAVKLKYVPTYLCKEDNGNTIIYRLKEEGNIFIKEVDTTVTQTYEQLLDSGFMTCESGQNAFELTDCIRREVMSDSSSVIVYFNDSADVYSKSGVLTSYSSYSTWFASSGLTVTSVLNCFDERCLQIGNVQYKDNNGDNMFVNIDNPADVQSYQALIGLSAVACTPINCQQVYGPSDFPISTGTGLPANNPACTDLSATWFDASTGELFSWDVTGAIWVKQPSVNTVDCPQGAFTASGTILSSVGVTSITRPSTGRYRVNLSVPQANTNYVVLLTKEESSTTRDDVNIDILQGSKTTTSFEVIIHEGDNGTAGNVFRDRNWNFNIPCKENFSTGLDSMKIINDSLVIYEADTSLSVLLTDLDSTNEKIDTMYLIGDSIVIVEGPDTLYLNYSDGDWKVNEVGSSKGLQAIYGSSTATGDYSLAAGLSNSASGYTSISLGGSANSVSEIASVNIGGSSNTVSGRQALNIGGFSNTVSGFWGANVGGTNNTVLGDFGSVLGGTNNTASSYGETVLGYNSTTYTAGSAIAIDTTDKLLVIGNGRSSTARSNALTLLKDGRLGLGVDGNSVQTATLHIRPQTNIDPLRVDSLNPAQANDTAILVVNPSNGTVRYLDLDSLTGLDSIQYQRTDTMKFFDKGEVITLDVANTMAEIYDVVGGDTLLGGFSDLQLATDGIVDANYTTTDSSITVTNSGRYRITYRVTTEMAYGNNRSGSEYQLVKNGSTVISGTYSAAYHRNLDADKTTATVTKVVNLTAGDKISVQGRQYVGSGRIHTSANGSSLLIERL